MPSEDGHIHSRKIVFRCIYSNEYAILDTVSSFLGAVFEYFVVILAKISQLTCTGIHPPDFLLIAGYLT